jgi:PKD repeat protein
MIRATLSHAYDILIAAFFAIAAFGNYETARPTSRFTYKCDPAPALRCTFRSTSLGNPSVLEWDWADGRKDIRTARSTDTLWKSLANIWTAPGSYRVRLTVTDSIGGTSYSTQLVTVPIASSATSKADTVRIVDTVKVPCICDTTTVPASVPPATSPPLGETWAELPRVYLDTKLPPSTGATIAVPAGGDLQAALNAAQPGDVITLANGAMYAGNFILPNKSGASWITIRPASMAGLPLEGQRMHPRFAASLPKVVSTSNQGAFATADGAHHYRLVALEVTVPPTTANTGLIRLGTGYETTAAQLPHDLILDRMYIHGTPTGVLRRAVSLNGASSAVVDSYISEVHDNGPDSQAIWGASGPGPFKITNNYLEAASENVMFGGADPLITQLIPSDIEIRGNHITKPLAWQGKGFNVKNLFEVKNAQRVLIEGNVFENNWAEGQGGSAIVLKSVNQSQGCPWCAARDIAFRKNVIRNVGSGFALTGHDVGAQSIMTRVTITDNLVTGIDRTPFTGDGRGFLINNDPIDLVIAHNTVLDATNSAITFGGPATEPPTRLTIRDNILDGGQYGVKGQGMGAAAALLAFMPSGFRGNLVITADPTGLPSGTAVPTRAGIGFAADLRLSASSPYRGKATISRDPGADVGAVLAATARVVQP